MNCSQFEVGKSPFIPSLHFLLLSSSLHSGSSPLGERFKWKRWAESRSEARSTAERHGALGHVSTAFPPHGRLLRMLLQIQSLGVWAQKMCHPQKRWKLERMRSLPPGTNLFPLPWPVSAYIIKWATRTQTPPSFISVNLSLKSKCPSTRCTWTTTL